MNSFITSEICLADIPTTLIEAFRATLNDAVDAHLIIHVCDISHPDHAVQRKIVMDTLLELDVPTAKLESMITVFNKSDLLGQQTFEENLDEDDIEEEEEEEEELDLMDFEDGEGIKVSCKTGEGLDQLIDLVQKRLMIASDRIIREYRVLQGGQLYQTLVNDELCTIENMVVDDNDSQFIRLKCLFSKVAFAKFQARYPGAVKYQIRDESS